MLEISYINQQMCEYEVLFSLIFIHINVLSTIIIKIKKIQSK